MEAFFIFLLSAWLLLPLPICIYLFKQNRKRQQEIEGLQKTLSQREGPRSKKESTTPEQERERTAPSIEGPEKPQTIIAPEPPVIQPIPRPTFSDTQPDTSKPRAASEKLQSLRNFLVRIGLWPPEACQGLESGIIPWLAPRIGGFLGILAAIFFAVYMGRNTVPWVRFIELFSANIGVLLTSFVLYRKGLPQIAAVVEGTGLAMLYLCSVAAYAASPVRIIENPLTGLFVQLLATLAMFTWSVKKDRRVSCHLAICFAYATATFGAYEGLRESALGIAFMIHLSSLLIIRIKDWKPLLYISVPGVYIPLTAFLVKDLTQLAQLPHPLSLIAFIGITLSLLPLAHAYIPNLLLKASHERSLHALNSSLALSLGYLYLKHFDPDALTLFYGINTLIYSAWALRFFFLKEKTFLFHLFFLKSSLLLALYLSHKLAGDLRWYSLFWEVLAIAPLVRKRANAWILIAPAGILTYALYLLGQSYNGIPDAYSFKWGLYLSSPWVLVLGLAAMTTAYRHKKILEGPLIASSLIPLIWLSFILMETAWSTPSLIYAFILCCLIASGLSVIKALSSRYLMPFAFLLFIQGHLHFTSSPYDWGNLIGLLGLSVLFLYGLQKTALPVKAPRRTHGIEMLIHALWITSLATWLEGYTYMPYIHLAYPLLSIGLFIASKHLLKSCADIAILPLIIYLLQAPHLEHQASFYALSILLMMAYHIPHIFPQAKAHFRLLKAPVWQQSIWFIVCWSLLKQLSEMNLSWAQCGYFWIALGILQPLIARLYRGPQTTQESQLHTLSQMAFLATPALLIYTWWGTYHMGYDLNAFPWSYQWLLVGSLSALSWILFGCYSQKTLPRHKFKEAFLWVSAIFGYGLIIATYNFPRIELSSWLTSIFASSCIILVIAGFMCRIKAFRLTGVFGLLYPIYRLFIYDIEETIYRIIAFAVLSLIMTGLGLLYHRFSKSLQTPTIIPEPDSDPQTP